MKKIGFEKGDNTCFKDRACQRFVNQVNRIVEKYNLNDLILVLDLHCAAIISSLFSITDLVEHKITFIERLELRRKALPNYHALYFINPTGPNIDFLLSDFKDADHPQYQKIHLLFSAEITREQLKAIGSSKSVINKISRHSIKQFYFGIQLISLNSISMGIPYLASAFSRESNQELQKRFNITSKFVDIIANFSELNRVKIYYERTASKITERIATKVQSELKRYFNKLIESGSFAISAQAKDISIFLVDRSIDVVTPLLHGFTYEAMLFDLLNLQLNENVVESKDEINLNQIKGDIFEQFRYQHIVYALSNLPKRLESVEQETKALLEMPGQQAAAKIKTLQESIKMLKKHVELLDSIWKIFQERHLKEVGELELSLATGITEDQKETNSLQLYNQVIDLIKNNLVITSDEKLRLALLVLTCIKLTKHDYQQIVHLFSETDQKALRNVIALGVRYDGKISRSTKNVDKMTRDKAKNKLKNRPYPSERHSNAIQIIIPRLIDYLKKENVQDRNIMQVLEVSAISGKNQQQKGFDEQRFICFMVGGLSPTQICSLKKQKSLASVILATDSVLSPTKFLAELRKIDILQKFEG